MPIGNCNLYPRSCLEEGDKGSNGPNCQKYFAIVHNELSYIFYKQSYHLAWYKPSFPSIKGSMIEFMLR